MDSQSIGEFEQLSQYSYSHPLRRNYDVLFHFSPLALLRIDTMGNIKEASKAAIKLFSLVEPGINIINKNLVELVYIDSANCLEDFIQQVVQNSENNVISADVQLKAKYLQNIFLRLNFFVVDRNYSRSNTLVVLIEDISNYVEEHQNLQRCFEDLQIVRDDLEERTSELVLANEKLLKALKLSENMNRNKNRLFSIISHDLRGPFNALLGLTELLVEDFESLTKDEVKDSIHRIYRNSQGLFSLINDLLEWSKTQFKTCEYHPAVFKLSDIVDQVIKSLESILCDKELKIVNIVPRYYTISADQNMLSIIIRNLVNNAIKFTPKKGTILISAGYYINDFVLSIEDSGIGMSQETIERLFNIGEKISIPGTEGETGTGLGLLICEELVRKHNGQIWAKSKLRKGSKFFISIPIENYSSHSETTHYQKI